MPSRRVWLGGLAVVAAAASGFAIAFALFGAKLYDAGQVSAAIPDVWPRPADAVPPALPKVHNYSGASPARADAMVREAIASLGFPAGAPDGPQPADRFFVGRSYMAWIDETGFYGKINGLWRLDGAAGDALDFVLRTPRGRPISMLAVAENGDGKWLPAYSGAEHLEAPSRVPEANDDAACAKRDWCNQYGLNEAGSFTKGNIPWWSACNAGSPSFLEHFEPIEVTDLGTGLRIVYEGPLVKEADGDGRYDGDDCHADWLFPDRVRRPVYLRTGYELRGDADWLDRIVQIRNPVGNPPFSAPMGLIGGFVVTSWPYSNAQKRVADHLRPVLRDLNDTAHGIVLRTGSTTCMCMRSAAATRCWLGWASRCPSARPTAPSPDGR